MLFVHLVFKEDTQVVASATWMDEFSIYFLYLHNLIAVLRNYVPVCARF